MVSGARTVICAPAENSGSGISAKGFTSEKLRIDAVSSLIFEILKYLIISSSVAEGALHTIAMNSHLKLFDSAPPHTISPARVDQVRVVSVDLNTSFGQYNLILPACPTAII